MKSTAVNTHTQKKLVLVGTMKETREYIKYLVDSFGADTKLIELLNDIDGVEVHTNI